MNFFTGTSKFCFRQNWPFPGSNMKHKVKFSINQLWKQLCICCWQWCGGWVQCEILHQPTVKPTLCLLTMMWGVGAKWNSPSTNLVSAADNDVEDWSRPAQWVNAGQPGSLEERPCLKRNCKMLVFVQGGKFLVVFWHFLFRVARKGDTSELGYGIHARQWTCRSWNLTKKYWLRDNFLKVHWTEKYLLWANVLRDMS